jgi:hypothetical protein
MLPSVVIGHWVWQSSSVAHAGGQTEAASTSPRPSSVDASNGAASNGEVSRRASALVASTSGPSRSDASSASTSSTVASRSAASMPARAASGPPSEASSGPTFPQARAADAAARTVHIRGKARARGRIAQKYQAPGYRPRRVVATPCDRVDRRDGAYPSLAGTSVLEGPGSARMLRRSRRDGSLMGSSRGESLG